MAPKKARDQTDPRSGDEIQRGTPFHGKAKTLIENQEQNIQDSRQPLPAPPKLEKKSETLSFAWWIERFTEHPKEWLVMTVIALGGICGYLGMRTHAAREALIGSNGQLSYDWFTYLRTGIGTLGDAALRLLSAFLLDHPTILIAAASLFLANALAWWAARWRPAFRLAFALVLLIPLLPATAFYAVTIAAGNPVKYSEIMNRDHSATTEREDLLEQAVIEACSWLVNDSPTNDGRRKGLAGLCGWLLILCVLMMRVAAANWQDHRGKAILGGFFFLILALFSLLRLVPRADAYSTWGLKYPRIELVTPHAENLPEQVLRKDCCLYAVSAGANEQAFWVACPNGPSGLTLLPAMTKGGKPLKHGWAVVSGKPVVIIQCP